MNWKHQQSIYHGNGNVNLMVENVTQIKSGIMYQQQNKKDHFGLSLGLLDPNLATIFFEGFSYARW